MALRSLYEERGELVKKLEGEDKETLRKYVTAEKGRIKVDWVNLRKRVRNHPGEEFPGDYEDILYYLKIKGILVSAHSKGGFFVFGNGIDLSPRGSVRYHFTRKTDAVEYAKTKKEDYGRNYPMDIVKKLDRID